MDTNNLIISFWLFNLYLSKFNTSIADIIVRCKEKGENVSVDCVKDIIQEYVMSERQYKSFFKEATFYLKKFKNIDMEKEVFKFMYEFIPLPK